MNKELAVWLYQMLYSMAECLKWKAATSGVAQRSVLGPKLFNILTNDITVGLSEPPASLHVTPSWVIQSILLREINTDCGMSGLRAVLYRRTWSYSWMKNWTWVINVFSQSRNSIITYTAQHKVLPAVWRKWYFPSTLLLWQPTFGLAFNSEERHGSVRVGPKDNQGNRVLEYLSYKENVRELGLFIQQKKGCWEGLTGALQYLEEGYKKDGKALFFQDLCKGKLMTQGPQRTCSSSVIGSAQGLNGHDFGHPDIVQAVLPNGRVVEIDNLGRSFPTQNILWFSDPVLKAAAPGIYSWNTLQFELSNLNFQSSSSGPCCIVFNLPHCKGPTMII